MKKYYIAIGAALIYLFSVTNIDSRPLKAKGLRDTRRDIVRVGEKPKGVRQVGSTNLEGRIIRIGEKNPHIKNPIGTNDLYRVREEQQKKKN